MCGMLLANLGRAAEVLYSMNNKRVDIKTDLGPMQG